MPGFLFSTGLQAKPESDACLEQGALAYDDWTSIAAGGGGMPAGEAVRDYLRCKSCHGWDRRGMDGGFVRRQRTSERPNAGLGDSNIVSRNIAPGLGQYYQVTPSEILHTNIGRSFADGSGSWVTLDSNSSSEDRLDYATGYTLGNQHPDFSTTGVNAGDTVPTQDQVECLADFINLADADPKYYFEDIDIEQNPVFYAIHSGADAGAGKTFYDGQCLACHGDPATDYSGSNGGKPEGGILEYLQGDGKYSEFVHKARWGIPGSSMTRAAMGNPDSQNMIDVMLYLQELDGGGFTINPGLSGHWWGGETRSGEGFLIEVALASSGEVIIVVSFYTYDSAGNQAWLIGAGAVDGNIAEIVLEFPEGAYWGADFDPNDVPDPRPIWGTGMFTFSSCGSGSVSLVPNMEMQSRGFTDLSYAINRDLLITGVECPTPTN